VNAAVGPAIVGEWASFNTEKHAPSWLGMSEGTGWGIGGSGGISYTWPLIIK